MPRLTAGHIDKTGNPSSKSSAWQRWFADQDIYFVSFPKSGRTWFRVFMCAYLSHLHNRPFNWNATELWAPHKIGFTHDRWEHDLMIGWKSRVRGDYLIPSNCRGQKRSFCWYRDPRDTIVSLFFHLTKRHRRFRYCPKSLTELVRHPRFGIHHLICLMNLWWNEWNQSSRFLLLRYEKTMSNPAFWMRKYLEFVEMACINPVSFEHALDFSSFNTCIPWKLPAHSHLHN